MKTTASANKGQTNPQEPSLRVNGEAALADRKLRSIRARVKRKSAPQPKTAKLQKSKPQARRASVPKTAARQQAPVKKPATKKLTNKKPAVKPKTAKQQLPQRKVAPKKVTPKHKVARNKVARDKVRPAVAPKPSPKQKAQATAQTLPQKIVTHSQLKSAAGRLLGYCGFAMAAYVLWFGWSSRHVGWISAEEGMGYALGIASVCCICVLLVYPLRKRLRFLGFIGSIKNWFRTHQIMGVTTTITGLYHCNFQTGSLNSQIALVSLLLVAGSGLIGRFLYRRIHRTLYGRTTNLNKLRANMRNSQPAGGKVLKFLPLVKQRLSTFDETVFRAGHSLRSSLLIMSNLAFRARREQKVLVGFCSQQLAKDAKSSVLIEKHHDRLLQVTLNYLEEHMRQLRLVAKMQAYERLFALWHIVHLPFFALLVLSVIVHVLAVHLY